MQRFSALRPVALAFTLLALAGCGERPPASAYLNRGGPESLIDVSSEVVNLGTGSKAQLKELSEWIEKDQPTRASLNCHASDKNCAEARKILDLHGVPVTQATGSQQTVTLVYERILARDCHKSYLDNPHNFYNTNHPSFGCSVAANMVQHVTDKQEFINPSLSDDPSAVRAVNDLHRAYVPRDVVQPYAIQSSQTESARSE